ncbi:hypothetical protein PV08_07516 [Exophiala spinifera]|uniref:Heterokaryon incompatibility domain-containing protein n=1 Tax=Exophiala spinifera TaxID=91928 RepID=A0A0D1ZPI4_9EURO|nr:uncharacterized protein PV08_07516 [Exophiala spinifera]KIW14732.1 hypothetical protein PV08_07516 [Exophiala spinifera]
MPYKYQPLDVNDIRLLTLHPIANDADSSSTIICTLEHVDLTQGADVNRETQACKGSTYVWPEVLMPYDFRPLFKPLHSRRRCLPLQLPTSLGSSAEPAGNENELPWRRTWGDYVVLSYYWGPEMPKSSIILNGEPFQIRQNLHDALDLLRSCARIRQGFKLWVDSICINQDDTAERNQQVSRMRDIYASAWQVVTWLGPARGDSDFAVAALQWIAARKRPFGHTNSFYYDNFGLGVLEIFGMQLRRSPPLRDRVYKALAMFFLRQYWQRLWILQEVAIARVDAPIACGNCWLTWDVLRTACTFIAQNEKRFGREIISCLRPYHEMPGKFEAGRDRVPWERHWASERMWGLVLEITKLQQDQRVVSNNTGATDVTRPLLLGLEAQSELAQDRIYGLLGLKAIADRTAITPVYGSSLQETYKNFSLQLLLKGDLNTLQLVSRHCVEIYRHQRATLRSEEKLLCGFSVRALWDISVYVNSDHLRRGRHTVGTTCVHSLPSWAICMICRPIPTARLRGPYRAGGSRPSRVVAKAVSNNGLLVQGMLLDVITSLGACHEYEMDESYPTTSPTGPQLNAYGDLEGARTALSRTIIADTTARGIVATATNMETLLNGYLWRFGMTMTWTYGFSVRNILLRNRELVLSGYTLDRLIPPSPRDMTFNEWIDECRDHLENDRAREEALSWAVDVLAWRRLLSTKTGRMGLAPAGARLGDSIAILLGCDMPLVLRRRDNGGWIVVGECYVHGVMYGEGTVLGHDKFEEITLY